MLNIALKESRKSIERCQHGAAIGRGGALLTRGHNSRRTHPKFGIGPMRSLHAEATAIRAAVNMGINLAGTTIYVARNGHRLSKPCPGCQALIKQHGISKIVYTGDNGEILTEWPLAALLLNMNGDYGVVDAWQLVTL